MEAWVTQKNIIVIIHLHADKERVYWIQKNRKRSSIKVCFLSGLISPLQRIGFNRTRPSMIYFFSIFQKNFN